MNQVTPVSSRRGSFSDWEEVDDNKTPETDPQSSESFIEINALPVEQTHADTVTQKVSQGTFAFNDQNLTLADLKVIIGLKKSAALLTARPQMNRCLEVLQDSLWAIPYSLASRITLVALEADNLPNDSLDLLSSRLLGAEDKNFVKMPLSSVEDPAKKIHRFIVYERLNRIESCSPDLLEKDPPNEPLSFGALRKQTYKELSAFGVGTNNHPLRQWAWKLTGPQQIRRFNFQELHPLAITYSILGLDDEATINERIKNLHGEQIQTIFQRAEKSLFFRLPNSAYAHLPLKDLKEGRWEIIFPKENIENESETYKARFNAIAPKKLNPHRDTIPVYLQGLLPPKK